MNTTEKVVTGINYDSILVGLNSIHLWTRKTSELGFTEVKKPYDKIYLKGIGSILFLKNSLKKNAENTIKIISEVIIMRYVQL
jgi:hypothetical protein